MGDFLLNEVKMPTAYSHSNEDAKKRMKVERKFNEFPWLIYSM